MLDNIITEVGFILLGGVVALIPVYIMGLILRERIRGANERLREISIHKNLMEEKIDMQKSFIQELDEILFVPIIVAHY